MVIVVRKGKCVGKGEKVIYMLKGARRRKQLYNHSELRRAVYPQ